MNKNETLGKNIGKLAYTAANESQIAVIAFGMTPMDLLTPFMEMAERMLNEAGASWDKLSKNEVERGFHLGLLDAADKAGKLVV